MNLILICLVVLLIFGGGGHYSGYPHYGYGGAVSLIVFILVGRALGLF